MYAHNIPMKNVLKEFLDLIYENSCLICKQSSSKDLVCHQCENSFIQRELNYNKTFNDLTIYSWGLYEGKLRDGIIQLKSGKKKLAKYFALKLADFWSKVKKNSDLNNYVVIPIPSHKKRIRERGYCQTSLIASNFAGELKINYLDKFITRNKETSFMNKLDSINDRKKNIENAFKLTDLKPESKNIILIDDILTSGSTMCELGKTIKQKYPHIELIGLTVASGDKYQ